MLSSVTLIIQTVMDFISYHKRFLVMKTVLLGFICFTPHSGAQNSSVVDLCRNNVSVCQDTPKISLWTVFIRTNALVKSNYCPLGHLRNWDFVFEMTQIYLRGFYSFYRIQDFIL